MKSCAKLVSAPLLKHSGKAGSLSGTRQGAAAERPRGRELQALSDTEGSRLHTKLNCRIDGSEHSGVVPLD